MTTEGCFEFVCEHDTTTGVCGCVYVCVLFLDAAGRASHLAWVYR